MGKKAKLNIPMFTALILLLLTMITTHMTTGLYARYTVSSSGEDSARVAKFDVDCEVAEVTGKEGEYTLKVTNRSEVAVGYRIDVDVSGPMSVAVGEGEPQTPAEGKNTVSFENAAWHLEADSVSEPIALKFALADWSGVTDPATSHGTTETVELGFTVHVVAEQID